MGGLQLCVVPVDRLNLVVRQVVVSRDQRLVVVYLLFFVGFSLIESIVC